MDAIRRRLAEGWRRSVGGGGGGGDSAGDILLRKYYYRRRRHIDAWLPFRRISPFDAEGSVFVSNASNSDSACRRLLLDGFDDHRISVEALMWRLGSDSRRGLAASEAERRLREFGRNCANEPPPLVLRLIDCACRPTPAMLSAAAAISAVIIVAESKASLLLRLLQPALMFASAAFTATITFLQEHRAHRVSQKVAQAQRQTARVVRDGQEQEVAASDLVVGDLLLLRAGDSLPADVRVVKSRGCIVESSAVTGSAEPQALTDECTSESPLFTRNLAFCCSGVLHGSASCAVVLTGANTLAGVGGGDSFSFESAPVLTDLRGIVRAVTVLSVLVAIATLVAMATVGYPLSESLLTAAAVAAVGSIDWLLPLCRLCVSLAAGDMSDAGCSPTRAPAAEKLASVSAFCCDVESLGGEATISRLWCGGVEVFADAVERNDAAWCDLLRAASISCSTKRQTQTDAALQQFCDAALQRLGGGGGLRRRQSQLGQLSLQHGDGVTAHVLLPANASSQQRLVLRGPAAGLLRRCGSVAIDGGGSAPIRGRWRRRCLDACEAMSANGEEVLAFCDIPLPDGAANSSAVAAVAAEAAAAADVAGDDKREGGGGESEEEGGGRWRLLGFVSVLRRPSADSAVAAADCAAAGVLVAMATGSVGEAAAKLAAGVGIDPSAPIVDAAAVDSQQKMLESLRQHAGDSAVILAGAGPQRKAWAAAAFESLGRPAALAGVGPTDLPALRTASVGVAMPIGASEACCRAAGVVLQENSLAAFVAGVRESRQLADNLKKATLVSVSSWLAHASVTGGLTALGLPLALNSSQLLASRLLLQLLVSGVCCWRPESDAMLRAPRGAGDESVANWRLAGYGFAQLGVLLAAASWTAFFVVFGVNGFWPLGLLFRWLDWSSTGVDSVEDSFGQQWAVDEQRRLLLTCQTAFFAAIVLGQVAVVFAAATRRQSVLCHGVPSVCTALCLFLGTGSALLLSHAPGTVGIGAPLQWLWWLLPLPFCCLLLLLEEARKLAMRCMSDGNCVQRLSYY